MTNQCKCQLEVQRFGSIFQQELVEVDGVMKDICKYFGMKLTSKSNSGTNVSSLLPVEMG
jgi:hypothetical protein